MKSIRIGKLMGISLELHSTFVWLIVAIAIFLAIFDQENFIPTLVLLFLLFLSVFIHELFHSIVAVSKGSKVTKIILLPIGGISLSEELPEKPIDEFLIAVAGPFFNFAIVFLIIVLVAFVPILPWPWHLFNSPEVTAEMLNDAILQYPLFGLFWVNFILGAFNLFLPALPLDGGRVLRSILALRLGFNRATHITTKISSVVAILLLLLGFMTWNIILLIIAVFIFLGSSQEDEIVLIKETLKGVDLKKIINKRPTILDSSKTAREAFNRMKKKNRTAFLVRSGKSLGYIDADILSKEDKQKWDKIKLKSIMQKIPPVRPIESSGKIMSIIMSKNYPFIPIVNKGKLIGVIEKREINKLYKLIRLDNRS